MVLLEHAKDDGPQGTGGLVQLNRQKPS